MKKYEHIILVSSFNSVTVEKILWNFGKQLFSKLLLLLERLQQVLSFMFSISILRVSIDFFILLLLPSIFYLKPVIILMHWTSMVPLPSWAFFSFLLSEYVILLISLPLPFQFDCFLGNKIFRIQFFLTFFFLSVSRYSFYILAFTL